MPAMAIDLQIHEYICPGERHPISRAIHLARLAAAFPPCRECPLCEGEARYSNDDPVTLSIPPAQVARNAEGIRGIFHNEMTRGFADALAMHFADRLWERAPVHGPNDGIDRGARQARPTLVVGYDERPSSPAIFAAAVAGLRRMGCHVLEVGLVTKPCFWFAVSHVHASGGLFVTGSGTDPAWTGIDFLWEGARPLSRAEVSKLRDGAESTRGISHLAPSRPTRSSGTHRTFQAVAPYEESIAKHFADLQLCKVVCACASPLVGRFVQRLLKSSCELIYTELPIKVRDPTRRRDEGILRLSSLVRESQAQLGILIDDDGQRCGFVDERGRHVSPLAIARLVVPLILGEQPGSTVVFEPAAFVELRPLIEAMGGRCQTCSPDSASIAAAILESRAIHAGGDSGRHWFLEGFANCDALLVISRVLKTIARTDQPFSQLAVS
jgi:phosphomannomutase